MNFRYLIILLTVGFLIVSCTNSVEVIDEPIVPPFSWGEGTVEVNGEEIMIPFRAKLNEENGTVDICHSSNKRYLCFENIPFQSGIYSLYHKEFQSQEDLPYFYYINKNGDALGPEYDLDESQEDNYFEITAVDDSSLEISGNFNLTLFFGASWDAIHWPHSPDTLVLSNGFFHTKIL